MQFICVPDYDSTTGAIRNLNFKLKPFTKKDFKDKYGDKFYVYYNETETNPDDEKTDFYCVDKTDGRFKIECPHPGAEIRVVRSSEVEDPKVGFQGNEVAIGENGEDMMFRIGGEIPPNLQIIAHITVVKQV